jgi:hypothetical protein
MPSADVFSAINQVRQKFPPGSLIEGDGGQLCMIGVRSEWGTFWLMSYEPQQRFRLHALLVLYAYRLAPSQIRDLDYQVQESEVA